MPQLLIELFSEEIPARMQLGAARDFERLFGAKLNTSGLSFESIKAYVAPRRLALVVEGLPAEQAAVTEEVKGPKDGAPEQAMAGFLRKVGLTQDQLVLENGVWMARIEKPGRRTVDALPDMLREVILAFPWPKSMRSGVSSFRWVRPLKRILFLFDGQIVPFELEGLTASSLTEGHRFLGSGKALNVSDFASYHKALADNSVILDHAERQAFILKEAKAVCEDTGCELIEDQGLLEEVAGLNEFPMPILGDMDPKFLALPPEVIKTSMRTHQKYFAVRDKATGKMAPHFIIVANIRARDGGDEIKRGNAKVLSARLSDGVFFWNEDNKAGNFDGWLERLKGTTFHVKLGTMAQRVERISALAAHIAGHLGADIAAAREAARLAKADLASKMVGEFPELQGVMGGYYADALKLKPEIADAIREHYKPQGPSDSVPAGKVSAAVALADKIDTLVGFFAIGEKPTGSKDPYALRRSALGVLRIIREHGATLHLGGLVDAWYRSRGELPVAVQDVEAVRPEVLDFFADRLKVQLRDEGRRFDVLEATRGSDDVVNTITRIEAVEAVIATPQGEDLLTLHKRAANILAASKTDLSHAMPQAYEGIDPLEKALLEALNVARSDVVSHISEENYAGALKSIAALRQNVDSFLDGVLVNADDEKVKVNRLAILRGVCELSAPIADLSKIA
ncbi:glycyl-tRNA synthetase beta subunit [Asticcacaulis biprosthecium C19]|uniref:Glycine--tRNA ligase beta subunit n=1 Tax=Asticcacaulis biprosthecium C19 TaxID=715226 RepID=F4QRA8_9CAUL|nr:glycine--tRNA ligase subunit beta [Asticcacaulis biprosthecium]EGF90745.1 glycyl-tRNA synthetase beta subunit [Asticcacaulis biprosthecium C19]